MKTYFINLIKIFFIIYSVNSYSLSVTTDEDLLEVLSAGPWISEETDDCFLFNFRDKDDPSIKSGKQNAILNDIFENGHIASTFFGTIEKIDRKRGVVIFKVVKMKMETRGGHSQNIDARFYNYRITLSFKKDVNGGYFIDVNMANKERYSVTYMGDFIFE
jgi:ketosteroid isomerase-like protein